MIVNEVATELSSRVRAFFSREKITVSQGGKPPAKPPKNGRPWGRVLLAASAAVVIGIVALSPSVPIGPANIPDFDTIKIQQTLGAGKSEQSRYIAGMQATYDNANLPARVVFIDRDTATLAAGLSASGGMGRDVTDVVRAMVGQRAHVTLTGAQAAELARDLQAPGADALAVNGAGGKVCVVVPSDANTSVLEHMSRMTSVNADALLLMGIDESRIGLSADETRHFLDHRAAAACLADQIYPKGGSAPEYQAHKAAVFADVMAAMRSSIDGYPQTARKMAFFRSLSTARLGPALAGQGKASFAPVINYSENALYQLHTTVGGPYDGVGWRNLSKLSEGQLETIARRITENHGLTEAAFYTMHDYFADPAGTQAQLDSLPRGNALRLEIYGYNLQMRERLANYTTADKLQSVKDTNAALAEGPSNAAQHGAADAIKTIVAAANQGPDGLAKAVTETRDHLRQQQNLGRPNSQNNDEILRMIDRWLMEAAAKQKDAAPAATGTATPRS